MNTSDDDIKILAERLVDPRCAYAEIKVFEVAPVARWCLERLVAQTKLNEEECLRLGCAKSSDERYNFYRDGFTMRHLVDIIERLRLTSSPSKAGEPQGVLTEAERRVVHIARHHHPNIGIHADLLAIIDRLTGLTKAEVK